MPAASDYPSPSSILTYYKRSLEAIHVVEFAFAPRLSSLDNRSQFFGLAQDEFHEALAAIQTELDHQVVLSLTAAFEAIVKKDLQSRVMRPKRKDRVSRKMRTWWHATRLADGGKRRPTTESILDQWRAEVGRPHVIGRLKSLFKHRHWLAHGRYWQDKSGLGNVYPYDAWEIGKAVFDILPGFDRLPEWDS